MLIENLLSRGGKPIDKCINKIIVYCHTVQLSHVRYASLHIKSKLCLPRRSSNSNNVECQARLAHKHLIYCGAL